MMNNYNMEYIVFISIGLVLTYLYHIGRYVDDNGMDEYDRRWGISGEGKERGITGIIYTNGQYDFWANFVDHNPWWI